MLNKIKNTIVFSLLIISQQTYAFNCDTQANGSWQSNNTWTNCNGTIPQNGDSVTIKTGHTVSLSTVTNDLESLMVEAGGDMNIDSIPALKKKSVGFQGSPIAVINANNTNTSSINLSNVTMDLANHLTINAQNKDLLLGTVDGGFDLILNSTGATRLKNTIGASIPLKSLVTDSAGITFFADPNVDTVTWTVFVDEKIEINDIAKLIFDTTLRCPNGIITFAQNLDSTVIKRTFRISESSNAIINFNDRVGALNELTKLIIATSNGATVNINTSEIKTLEEQLWDIDIILNSPIQEVLMSSSTGSEIRLGKASPVFSVRSLVANTDSLIINTAGTVNIMSNIGDNNQALNNMTVNSSANILFNQDQVIVNDSLILAGPVTLAKDLLVQGQNIDIQNNLDNAGFNLTIDASLFTGISNISGVLNGPGDFIKNGSGSFDLASINTTTGNVILNNGFLFTSNISENVIPLVPMITVGTSGVLGLHSSNIGVFQMQNAQVINGTGNLLASINVPPDAVIAPGSSPGVLTGQDLIMNTGAQLSIELNGLNVGTQFDQLVVQSLNLDENSNGGATLNVTIDNNFSPMVGDTFKIIDVINPANITGTFDGLPQGARFFSNDSLFTINYSAGDGNDVVISTVAGAIIYVDGSGSAGGDGSSWAMAFDNLQDALAVAVLGDDVWITHGVYYPDVGVGQTDDLITSTFILDKGVKLYGGFNGTETDVSMRDPLANVTVLSGDLSQDDDVDGNGVTPSYTNIVGDNAFNVLYALNTDDTTLIDGLTITGGKATGTNPRDKGAAIYCEVGSVRINQVIVRGNRSENRANMWKCSSVITQSSFINNRAGRGTITTTPATFIDVLFMGNKSFDSTRGVVFNMANGGILNLTRATFIANVGNGPIIKAQSINVSFNEVLFSGNEGNDGVILLSNTTSGTLNNITITGNISTTTNGAAIESNSSGNINLNNSIIWNNQDVIGAGTLENSISHTGAGVVTVNSSIVQGFTGDPLWDTAIIVDGGGNLDEDPLFVLDTDPTTAPTVLGNARLTELSMAIDTGDNSVVNSAVDLDGRNRIFNGFVDRGAYEYIGDNMFKDGFE